MAKERHKLFRRALINWLRADATLVSLTSHTSSNLSIVAKTLGDPEKVPALLVEVLVTQNMVLECDTYKESLVRLTAYSTTAIAASDIIGQVEELAKQNNTTLRDATFSDASIHCTVTPLDVVELGDQSTGATANGVYSATLQIICKWYELT